VRALASEHFKKYRCAAAPLRRRFAIASDTADSTTTVAGFVNVSTLRTPTCHGTVWMGDSCIAFSILPHLNT
jgi:hypothetical protein